MKSHIERKSPSGYVPEGLELWIELISNQHRA